MNKQHKFLTAEEIEELRELEAKATPVPWESGQHPAMKRGGIIKPVTFGMRVKVLPECEGGHVVLREEDADLIVATRNALPRLLSLLIPPTDAEVREAVEWVEEQLDNDWWEDLAAAKARIILSYVRAVQATRLTEKQMEAVKLAVNAMDCPTTTQRYFDEMSSKLRAAFPGVCKE